MFQGYKSPTLLRRSALAVRTVIDWAYGRQGRVRCWRLAVLTVYVVMNLGLPIGDFGPQAGASAKAADCRCSPDSRKVGRCCCVKRPVTTGGSGCCAAKVNSCFAKKVIKPTDVAAQKAAEPEETLAWNGGCPCGQGSSPIVLLCPQPRILIQAIAFDLPLKSDEWIPAKSCSPCGDRPRPFVPPPEFPVV